MNKLMTYPLIIFFVVMLVNQAYTYGQGSDILTGVDLSTSQNINGSGTLFQNGTETELGIPEDTQLVFDIDFVTGFLAVIIGIAILGAVLGITVLGSGLSERTQRIILVSAVGLGLWAIFSLLTYDLIASIPVFSTMMWLGFTFIYMIGFIKEINGGN